MMALVNQYAAAHGGTSRQGNANITLYALAKKSGASCTSSAIEAAGCIFNDLAAPNIHYPLGSPSNSVACKGGTLNCSATVASDTGVLVEPNSATTEAWTARAGYDLASGLGSFNANTLVTSWGTASTIGTATTLSLSPTTGITHGQNENVGVNVTVKAKTGSGLPSGDVALIATLADGSTLGIDQFMLANGVVASAKTQNLPGGTYNVSAHYAGDGTNAPSDSAPVQITVGKEASQVFIVVPTFDSQTGAQLNGNAASVQYGSRYIIRMYATNGSAAASATGPPSSPCYAVNEVTCPTGSVALSANSTPIDGGTFALNNEGYTRDIAPTLTGGTYPLVAKYSGDSSYNASLSATDNFVVTKAQTTTTFLSQNTNYIIVGTQSTFSTSTTATSFGVAPAGAVTVFLDGTALTPDSFSSNGQDGSSTGQASLQTFTTVILPSSVGSGMHQLTASFAGDGNYSASATAAMPVSIVNQDTISLAIDNTNVVYPATITLTALVKTSTKKPVISAGGMHILDQDGIPVQGTINYSVLSDSSGNTELQATLTTSPQFSGGMVAYYDGDSNFERNQSNLVFVNVTVPDFNVGPNQPVITVSGGQTASTTFTIAPTTSYTSTVQLQIPSGSFPPGISCNVSPGQVQLAAGKSATATVTCSVPAPSPTNSASRLYPIESPPRPPTNAWRALGFMLMILATLLALVPRRLRIRRLAYVCLLLGALSFAVGCGGGASSSGGGGGSGPTPTTTKLSVTSTTVVSLMNLQATVNVLGNSPTGAATLILDGTYVSPPATVQSGQAAISYYLGPPGAHTVIAKYSGDSKNLASQTLNALTVVQNGFAGNLPLNATSGPRNKQVFYAVAVQ
jgi:Bacterial Ig-like domain (group 3)